jgi:Beta-propeller repeat
VVIDPPLIYSTYLGGTHDDEAWSIAVDANGNAYVAGFTASRDFPVGANAYQLKRNGPALYNYNSFVTKFSPSGVVIYSTFLGGSGDMGSGLCPYLRTGDCGQAIAIDADGDAYIAGSAGSSDFPVTPNAYQQTFGAGSSDAFLSELSPDGSALLYSTYLGSSGSAGAIAIAKGPGGIYVGGRLSGASSFPTTPGVFERVPKGADNGFVAKFKPWRSGVSSLAYSTVLGGSSPANYGGVYALTVDSAGEAIVTGQTHSTDYPTTAGGLPTARNAGGGMRDVSRR